MSAETIEPASSSQFENERRLAASKYLVEQIHENRMHALDNVRVYGQNAVKGLFLLNGGASVALLTLVGSLVSRADSVSSMLVSSLIKSVDLALTFFSAGMLCSVATSAIAYFNYQYHVQWWWHPHEGFAWLSGASLQTDKAKPLQRISLTQKAGVLILVGSAIFFLAGGWEVRLALVHLAKGLIGVPVKHA